MNKKYKTLIIALVVSLVFFIALPSASGDIKNESPKKVDIKELESRLESSKGEELLEILLKYRKEALKLAEDPDKAIRYYKKALGIARKNNFYGGISSISHNLANIYREQKNYPEALRYFEIALENNKKYGYKKKVTEMQTRFDVTNKEKEILILKKDGQLKQLALTKQQNQKKFLMLISLLILGMAFILYGRYRLKVRVTRQLRLEMAERKRAEKELLQSMKMESVGILAGGIAHDFNNFITVIMGNVGMVAENSNLDNQSTKMLGSAEKACSQAADLSSKLVTFSRGDWLMLKELSIGKLLDYIFDHYPEMQPFLRNRNIPGDLPLVNGDERQLRQVILNLLQNAKEALNPVSGPTVSPDTGQPVIIEAQFISLDLENYLDLDEGDYVMLSIRDKGRGISPEIMKHIYDPYFSTKDTVTQKGLGLGLAICYSIIKKHNGHIAIESQEAKGTKVTLYLPVV